MLKSQVQKINKSSKYMHEMQDTQPRIYLSPVVSNKDFKTLLPSISHKQNCKNKLHLFRIIKSNAKSMPNLVFPANNNKF